MKKKLSLLMVALMVFLSISINVSAADVTAVSNGFSDVLFSNGYVGYCIDKKLSGAYEQDRFVAENDTTVATNNNTNEDISNYLKLLFTQHFNKIFVSDGAGGYIVDSSIADGHLQSAIWGLSDDGYTYQLSTELVNAVKAYTGPEIPDHGYKLTLENGDVITFDFIVLSPQEEGVQSFFCYKIQVSHEEPVTLYNVTVSSEGNGTATANPTSGPEGTEVTLSASADEGYEFKGWEVLSGNVSIEDNKFTIGTEDVEIKAIFEEIEVVPEPETYQVIITTEGNGTATADPTSGVEGTEVTLSASADEGYEFKGWEVLSGNVTIEDNKFTIGTEDVEIKAIFEEIEVVPEPDTYQVIITAEGNGTATADPTSGPEGIEVTLIASADEGYEFKGWEVLSGNVTIEDNKFIIGTEDVEIKAIFSKVLKITDQPDDLKVSKGTDAKFEVEAEGDSLTYQWFINRNDGKGWIKLVDATKNILIEDNVESNYSGFQYKCVITDANGESVETDIAVLFVSAETKAPETGDEINSLIWVMSSLVSGSSIILMKKKRD